MSVIKTKHDTKTGWKNNNKNNSKNRLQKRTKEKRTNKHNILIRTKKTLKTSLQKMLYKI